MPDANAVFRIGGISYLRIPAEDPQASAAFYGAVFGWKLRTDRDDPAFEDGTGHVIGHFANGGEVVDAPYPEGDLTVATFRDPTGNVAGVWQQGS